jgi:hypothetical protein
MSWKLRHHVTHGFQNEPINRKMESVEVTNRKFPAATHCGCAQDGGGACSHFQVQILRILVCTARFLAASPGGLRFKPGTRPWLAALSGNGLSRQPA